MAEDFYRDFLPRFIDAQRAFHDGNAEPNLDLWSTTDPVTLFAARGLVNAGTGDVTKTFRFVASTFSDALSFDWETLASGVAGDLAFTVAIERYTASADGAPAAATELRATHVYRLEDGHWRAVHRHADRRPRDQEQGLDEVIGAFREALREYVKGDAGPAMSFFSERDDVTLANPFEPPQRGPVDVGEAARQAAANFGVGGALRFAEVSSTFSEVSRYETADLGYVLQVERHEGRPAGRAETIVIALRATLVFRREGGVWKIVHRHADPITTSQPISTAVQS
jgi:ketosteroid isomerase-like protein